MAFLSILVKSLFGHMFPVLALPSISQKKRIAHLVWLSLVTQIKKLKPWAFRKPDSG
jgi:hypothetical protein